MSKPSNHPRRARSKRRIAIDREALKRAIFARGYATVQDWIYDGRCAPSRGSKNLLIDQGVGTPNMVRSAAVGLGLTSDALFPEVAIPRQPLHEASNAIRQAFINAVCHGTLLPETTMQDGKIVQTDVGAVLAQICRDKSGQYEIGPDNQDSLLKSATLRLVRDTWIDEAHDRPGTYLLHQPSIEECERAVAKRVAVEMIYAEPAIARAEREDTYRAQLVLQMDELIEIAKHVLHRGNGFRRVDHEFHLLWCECRLLDLPPLLGAVQSLDRYYLRWRSLLKCTFGDCTPEYVRYIQQFNKDRLSELVEIREAIKRSAGSTSIRQILDRHSRPVLWLLEECNRLSDRGTNGNGTRA